MKHLKTFALVAALSFSISAAHAQSPSVYDATVAKLDKEHPIAFFYVDGKELSSGIKNSVSETIGKLVPKNDSKKVHSILKWLCDKSGICSVQGFGGSLVRQNNVYKVTKFAYTPSHAQNGLLWSLPGANVNTMLSVIPQNALTACVVKVNPSKLYGFISDFSKIIKNDDIRNSVHAGAAQFSADLLNPYELSKQISGIGFFFAPAEPSTSVELPEDDISGIVGMLPSASLIIELKKAEYWNTLKDVLVKSGQFEYDSAAGCFKIASGITLFCQNKFVFCTNTPQILKDTVSGKSPNLLSNPEFKKYADVLTTTNGFLLSWNSKDSSQLADRVRLIASSIDESFSEDIPAVKPIAGISLLSKNRDGMTFRTATDSKSYALMLSGTNIGTSVGFLMSLPDFASNFAEAVGKATDGKIALPGTSAARSIELEKYSGIFSSYLENSDSPAFPAQDGVEGLNTILKSLSASDDAAELSKLLPLDGSLKEDSCPVAFFSPYKKLDDIDEDDLDILPVFIEKPWLHQGKGSLMFCNLDGTVTTIHSSFSTLEDAMNTLALMLDLTPEARTAYIKKAKALDIKCGHGPK